MTQKEDYGPGLMVLVKNSPGRIFFFTFHKVSIFQKNRICKYPEWELPDFELKTFHMIETLFGNNRGYKNCFIAYNNVKERILNMDFDVAIIGAGAYGFPVSAALRKQGKMVIELCSYTTMMFGIVGQRHIDFGFKEQYGTDEWIRTLETPPEYYKKIEDGCYW